VRLRRLSLALAILVLAGTPGAAQEAADVMRPCRRGDLLGHWQVIRFGFAGGGTVDRSDPAYQQYQRYVFHSNATMAYTATATAPTEDQERAFARSTTPTTWAVDGRGRLVRQHPGMSRVETSECQVVTQVVRDSRSPVYALPGDVVLTDQGADARPLARRLLRRLLTE
jgi:hypothetical protein